MGCDEHRLGIIKRFMMTVDTRQKDADEAQAKEYRKYRGVAARNVFCGISIKT